MSHEDTAPGNGATSDSAPAQGDEEKKQEESAETQERQRQEAWAARQALIQHGPKFVSPLTRNSMDTQVAGDQHGISGGEFHGTVNFFGLESPTTETLSGGLIPPEVIDREERVFYGCSSFDKALDRLRDDHVVILSGGRDTGRRTAALVLLRRLGSDTVRSVEAPDAPSVLSEQLTGADGYVLLNYAISRGRPLREPHLFAVRERLKRTGGRLVITVEPSAALDDVPYVPWEPPGAEDMLFAHISHHVGETGWKSLSALVPVKEFLSRHHRPATVESFARRLVEVHRGERDEKDLADYGMEALTAQVSRWLTDDQRKLRDKAFLISLAVFHEAPYAVAAELGDTLFVRLHDTATPAVPHTIELFGSTREDRLRLANARGYFDTDVTEWGDVHGQYVAAFREERTPAEVLEAVWNLYPSTRPDVVEWIKWLATDRRPLVRTRAASATALLLKAEFSSAMAHLIEPWADDRHFSAWLTAANALTLAHLLGVPTIIRVLRDWCTGDTESRRWTAIRAYALLGPVVHTDALDALLTAIHRQSDDDSEQDKENEGPTEGARQLAEALEVLLLAVGAPVLHALVDRRDDRAVQALALLAFLQACRQSEPDGSRPVILNWYTKATANKDDTTTQALLSFWDAVLADRTHTARALGVLGNWALTADEDPECERALASLLSALASTRTNQLRFNHLLRRILRAQESPSPAVQRLLALVSQR